MDEREKKEELEGKLIEEEAVREVTAGYTIPDGVVVEATVNINFKKGAEPERVTTKKDGARAEVQNNVRGTIDLIGKTGRSIIDPGE